MIKYAGVGLHSGTMSSLLIDLSPMIHNTLHQPSSFPTSNIKGIGFCRTLIEDFNDQRFSLSPAMRSGSFIPAICSSVTNVSNLSTSFSICSTVEHLLAALFALDETSAKVYLSRDCKEIPIGDGSAQFWAEAIVKARDSASISAAIANQKEKANKSILMVKKIVEARISDQSFGVLKPLPFIDSIPTLQLSLEVNFSPRLIFNGPKVFEYEHKWDGSRQSKDKWIKEIAPARTFCFVDDVHKMRKVGLAKGGSLDNSVVFNGDGSSKPLNPEGLRFPDEWIRHKALDCFGDLSLLINDSGSEKSPLLHARYEARFPGHALNHAMVTALLSDPSNYEIVHISQ